MITLHRLSERFIANLKNRKNQTFTKIEELLPTQIPLNVKDKYLRLGGAELERDFGYFILE